MARYTVKLTVEADRIDTLRKQVEKSFPEAMTQVEKINLSPSRADRLAEAAGAADNARSIIEELKDEMENWRDSLPENLQGGDKASQIEDAVSALEDLQSNLESCEFSVEFPGMY